jgi:hypothetical protein
MLICFDALMRTVEVKREHPFQATEDDVEYAVRTALRERS